MVSSNKKGQLEIVLEIESTLAKSSLVLFKNESAPYVLFSVQKEFGYKHGAGSSHLVKEMSNAVKEVIDHTIKNLKTRTSSDSIPTHISGVHCVMSSPWIVPHARNINITFAKKTKISHSFMQKILQGERFKLVPDLNLGVEVVEEKVFDVRLDGRSLTTWYDMKASDLTISFILSIAGAKVIHNILEACSHVVNKDRIKFHSSLILQYIALNHELAGYTHHSIAHIHGEMTDVAMINHGDCVFLASYPMGKNNIVREAVVKSGRNINQTKSILSLAEKGHLDESHSKKDWAVIRETTGKWSTMLKKILADQKEDSPETVLIFADEHKDLFIQSLHENSSLRSVVKDKDPSLLYTQAINTLI